MSPRSSTRSTRVTSSSRSVRRQAVHAAGPVASASASASSTSARSRSDVPTFAATSRIRSSSVRSRRVAVSGSRRCSATMNEASARSSSSIPIEASWSAAIRAPSGTWLPSPTFPMSWKRAPKSSASGWSASLIIVAMCDAARVRCASTVNRWYGSRWGRQRTSAQQGRNRCSRPMRSRTSSIRTPGAPRRRSPRNASRTSEVHVTGSSIVAAARASSVAAGTGPPASAAAARARTSPAGPGSMGAGAAGGSRIRAPAACTAASTSRACSNTACMSASVATSRGWSAYPNPAATSGCRSTTSRSARRSVSRWTALRTRTRNSSAASTEAASLSPSTPAAASGAPTASPNHPSVAASRSPPPPSFRSGSSRCDVAPYRSRRRAASASRSRTDAAASADSAARACSARRAARSLVTGDAAPVERRGPDVEAVADRRRGLGRGPHRVPDGEPGVPQRVQQRVGDPGDLVVVDPVVREQQVDIGSRELQAPPVAADRDEGHPVRWRGRPPQLGQVVVDQVGPPARRPPAVRTELVGGVERGQVGPQPGDRIAGHPDSASGPISPVRIRSTRSTSVTHSLPSPILPVRAAATIASTTSSTWGPRPRRRPSPSARSRPGTRRRGTPRCGRAVGRTPRRRSSSRRSRRARAALPSPLRCGAASRPRSRASWGP